MLILNIKNKFNHDDERRGLVPKGIVCTRLTKAILTSPLAAHLKIEYIGEKWVY